MKEPVILTKRFGGKTLTATLHCGDCMDLMPIEVDSVVSDPPFSAKTHSGHFAVSNGNGGEGYDKSVRKVLGYQHWDDSDVSRLCGKLPDSGWVCIITDHVLARQWERYQANCGRYVFAPLPIIVPGRSVRLAGDGPSSWTDWLVVSRTTRESRWGTLPGYYMGSGGSIEHMGGKPTDAMCRIVSDYSRKDKTVLDFCMGSGTTGVACLRTGRNFIGIEKDPFYFQTAVDRIRRECEQPEMFEAIPSKSLIQPTLIA